MTVRLAAAETSSEVRLTGEELAARGATDLASALRLLPDLVIIEHGYGTTVQIRGAEAFHVAVRIDGVTVSDPYFGSLDLTSIPVIDIAEIRVSLSPGSPLDGPGGSGGVIEVRTRGATDLPGVLARVTADSLPNLGTSATGQVTLTPSLALRLSASSLLGYEALALRGEPARTEHRRATMGAIRLEHHAGDRRVVVDGLAADRVFFRTFEFVQTILVHVQQTSARVALAVDDGLGDDGALLHARAWLQSWRSRNRVFRNADLLAERFDEDHASTVAGATARVTQPFGEYAHWVAGATVDHTRTLVKLTGYPSVGGSLHDRRRASVTLVELAAGAGFDKGPWSVDSVAGILARVGGEQDPTPEGELAIRYRKSKLNVEGSLARKGIVYPNSQRLYFEDFVKDGLPAWHGEVRFLARPRAGYELSVALFQRQTAYAIASLALVENVSISTRGAGVGAKVDLASWLSLGGTYEYGDVFDRTHDFIYPEDFPVQLAELWLESRSVRRITFRTRAHYIDLFSREDYVLWDATASLELRRAWTGTLRVDNLLDADPDVDYGDKELQGRSISLLVQRTWI